MIKLYIKLVYLKYKRENPSYTWSKRLRVKFYSKKAITHSEIGYVSCHESSVDECTIHINANIINMIHIFTKDYRACLIHEFIHASDIVYFLQNNCDHIVERMDMFYEINAEYHEDKYLGYVGTNIKNMENEISRKLKHTEGFWSANNINSLMYMIYHYIGHMKFSNKHSTKKIATDFNFLDIKYRTPLINLYKASLIKDIKQSSDAMLKANREFMALLIHF